MLGFSFWFVYVNFKIVADAMIYCTVLIKWMEETSINLQQLYIFKDRLTLLSALFLKKISIPFFPHLKDQPVCQAAAPQSPGVDFAGSANVSLSIL